MRPNTLISINCHVILPVSSYLIHLNIILTFHTSNCGLFTNIYLGSGKIDSVSIQHTSRYKLSKIYLINFKTYMFHIKGIFLLEILTKCHHYYLRLLFKNEYILATYLIIIVFLNI